MSDLRTAAQQALEALENSSPDQYPEDAGVFYDAKDALRAALEQPEQEQPVAWTTMPDADDWMFVSGTEKPPLPGEWHPLYTHPPRREPLSVEELDRLWREPMSADWEHREYARAVEAAHGIKEEK
jgi:hypothetical protein